jgi:tetratricopeptide (TPR) repeat protein
MDKRTKTGAPAARKRPLPSAKPPAKKPAHGATFPGKSIFLILVVLTLTFIVFLPVFSSDFLSTWDDSDYITKNQIIRSLNFENLKAMFSTQIGGTYVPLPLLSYAIEYKLFGLSSTAFHFTNLLIHLFCTLFVFEIFRRLGLKPIFAALGALLFGIHPMGVESVAWVTERKDLLYTFFYLAAIIAYLSYLKKEHHSYLYLGVTCGLFLLALLSKIQAVSLPLVLLVIDFYMKRPVRPKLLLEKIPFFILSLGFGIAGIFILKNLGALKINAMYTQVERLFFGSYAFDAYLLKFFVPVKLSALYPYPVKTGETLPAIYYLSPLIAALAYGSWKSFQKGREVIFGVLFFTLSVFFLLQIFGAGQGFMADRYTKIPYVGLIFIVAWWVQQYLGKHAGREILIFSLLSVLLIVFMVLSFRRAEVWKNGETLWTDVIAKYPDKDARPYACRGLYFKEKEQQEKALKDFSKDLAINPGDVEILQFRGNIFFNMGKDDSAYADYIRALKIRQDNALALANLGAIYVRRNQYDSALINLSKALEMDTSQYTAYANRAVVYSATGRFDESIADFKMYLKSKPDDERVCFSIGMIYFNRGAFNECIGWFNKAIAIKPGFANYHWMRSQAYRQTGNKQAAMSDATLALDLGMSIPKEYFNSLK